MLNPVLSIADGLLIHVIACSMCDDRRDIMEAMTATSGKMAPHTLQDPASPKRRITAFIRIPTRIKTEVVLE